MKKIIAYLKKVIGITDLENRLILLNRSHENLTQHCFRQEKILESVMEDNRVLIRQIKLINEDFSVAADINHSRYEPSVAIVMRNARGSRKEKVKTYHFTNETTEQVFKFLEGFSEDRTAIDFGRRSIKPKFRF
jgi:hypothetical protein